MKGLKNMNINAISSLNYIGNSNKIQNRQSFKGKGISDTFEKTVSPAEEAKNEAIKWLEETNYILNHLAATLADRRNIIGEGYTHIGVSIPENDAYIFRINRTNFPKGEIKDYKITDVEDKDLTVNIGQPVAEIRVKSTGSLLPATIQVLKRQKGEPVGIKPASAIYIEDTEKLREGEIPYNDISRKENYERTIHKVAQLPIEAYEKLIEDLNISAQNGYKFDYYNSNNILVDDEGKSLGLIDMEKIGLPVDYGSVLYALTNIQYFNTFTSKYDVPEISDEKKAKVLEDTVMIIDKYLKAMQNKGLKFNRDESSMYFIQLLESLPCKFYFRTFDIKEQWSKLAQMGLV